MIKNDRQYRITKAQAEEFEQALASLNAAPAPGLSPLIRKAQLDATRSQLDELNCELAEYDALVAGKQRVLELASLEELPRALIRARIASGLTQRDLAERLGVKEQQVQRYEATDYSAASLARINEVVVALGLTVREDVFLSGVDTSLDGVIDRLSDVGIDRAFVADKLMPAGALEPNLDGSPTSPAVGMRLSSIVNRVFGWVPAVLFGNSPLIPAPALGVRFKVPSNAEGRKTIIQAVYARYLSNLVLQAMVGVTRSPPSIDAQKARNAIVHAHGGVTLRACLEYAWSHGIPVLPLQGNGGFHGATWRLEGRNVIVLKQHTSSEARWVTDLLHEMRHAGEDPDSTEFESVDSESLLRDRRESPEEVEATTFAGDVVLDGRAEELAKKCVAEAKGRLEWLKTAVPRVAEREGIRVDALANYMAYRLAMQGQNWWGAATNLQARDENPWRIARDYLVEHLDLGKLSDIDRLLLMRALEGG